MFHSDPFVVQEGVLIDDLYIDGTFLSTEEFDTNTFSIYPNPSNQIFNIRTTTSEAFDFDIYDVTGKLIMSKRDISPANNEYKLDMNAFSKGIYFLNLTLNNSTVTKKLILN